MQPVHLLWINLVTDTFPAIALGVEPAEPGVMNHKPRGRKASFFSGGVMGAIIYQGILQTLLVLGVYGWAVFFPEHATRTEIHADALTMAFATLGLIQLVHAYNVKSVYQSIFKVGFFKKQKHLTGFADCFDYYACYHCHSRINRFFMCLTCR